ncbi:MAG: crossover junction endodeoxyribonuclease RuvC [Candidatus Hydrothermia bacterium]|jgi:crossover junction endodeoxyribonuclease RuvC
MIILGVDPGLRASGIVIIDNLGHIKYTDTIYSPPGPLSERLNYIYSELSNVLRTYHPDIGVMESTIYHRNVKTALTLGAVRGVIILAMTQNGVPVREISPTKVKLSLTGQGRAKKKQVAYMVKSLLNAKDEFTEHEYDALGVCLVYLKELKNAIRTRR